MTERDKLFLAALKENGGNIAGAGRVVDLKEGAARRLAKKLGIKAEVKTMPGELAQRFLATLAENGNNIARSAKIVGLSTTQGKRWAKKLGVVANPRPVGRPKTEPADAKRLARDLELKEKLPALLLEYGSKEKAARALGVGRKMVSRIMAEHELTIPPRVWVAKGNADVSPVKQEVELPPNPDDQWRPRIRELAEVYTSKERIAQELKIGIKRVRRIMAEDGIQVKVKPKPEPKVKPKAKEKPDRYAHIRNRLPQLFSVHGSIAKVCQSVSVSKKTMVRLMEEADFKPPKPNGFVSQKRMRPAPRRKEQRGGLTTFNTPAHFLFSSRDGDGESVVVEYCADPKLEKARSLLLQGEDEWDVHQRVGVPLRDVYRLRMENRERARGRM